MRRVLCAALAVFVLADSPARAACINPAGATGDIVFNAAYDVHQGCTQRGWLPFSKSQFTVSSSCPSSGLVGYWKFDESSGTSAADLSGNSNTGTLTNGPTWTTGHVNGALSFDGTDDFVNVPHSASISIASSFTIAAWVYPTALSGWKTMVSKTAASYSYYFQFGDDEFCFGFNGDHCTVNQNLSPNTWYHIAAVFDDAQDTMTIYLNGISSYVGSEADTIVTNTNPLNIGRNAAGNEYFPGKIDDVRIYNLAISAQDVADLYNSGAGCE